MLLITEIPLFDENFHNLRELTRILDIPIIGTEVIAKHPYSVAECISTRVVDMVRADVSWSGGITATMKTAHLAESFGVQCEIHTAIYHPLELVNLHCCAAVKNSEFFEVLDLGSHLSGSRANGLHAMVKRIHAYAKAYEHEQTSRSISPGKLS